MACKASTSYEEEEEVNMDMGQGFIGTSQELNVDRGTLPSTLACSCACSWRTATAQGAGGVHSCLPAAGHTHTSFSLSLFSLSLSLYISLSVSLSLCLYIETEKERDRERERRVCISRKSAASSSSDGWQPRTSARTCKSARQRSSIDIQFLRSANKSLSHVHLLLLLLLSALSWPGASDPAPYSCHPYPLYRLPILPTHARARAHTHTHTRLRRPRVH